MSQRSTRFSRVISSFLRIFPAYRSVKALEARLEQQAAEQRARLDSLEQKLSTLDSIGQKLDGIERSINQQLSAIAASTQQLDYVNLELLPTKIAHDIAVKPGHIKVLVAGFYGAPNMGDEAMLAALLMKLKARPNLDITVMFCYNRPYHMQSWGDISYLHYPQFPGDFIDLAREYDVVIFGGGALLDDGLYEDRNFYRHHTPHILMELSETVIALKKRLFLLGLSTSRSFINTEYVKRLDYIARNVTHASARDPFSIATLKAAGIDCTRVQLIHDIAFSLPLAKKAAGVGGVKTLGMVLIYCADREKNRLLLECALKFISARAEKWEILFISFYGYNDADPLYYRQLSKSVDFGGVPYRIADASYSVEQVLEQIAECSLMINLRYHAALFALRQAVPCINIVLDTHPHYPNKMKALAELFDLPPFMNLSSVTMENMFAAFSQAWPPSVEQMDVIRKRAEEISARSNSELDAILNLF